MPRELEDEKAIQPTSSQQPRLRRRKRRNYWAITKPADIAPFVRQPPLSYLQENRLLRLAQGGDTEARNKVWVTYLRMLFSVANSIYIPKRLMNDVIQEGAIGIQRAIERFDVDSLDTFSTFAGRYARRAMQEFIYSNAFPVHVPENLFFKFCRFNSAMYRAVSESEISHLTDALRAEDSREFEKLLLIFRIANSNSLEDSFEELIERPTIVPDALDASEVLRSVCDQLSDQEANVLCRCYGILSHRKEKVGDVAQQLGVSRRVVETIKYRAEARMRTLLGRHKTKTGPNDVNEL